MDELDRKILYLLDMNSRRPARQIADILGEKNEKINYRLNKLLKSGLIERCHVEVNPWKVGYTSFKIYMQFQGVDKKKIDEMYDFLHTTCNINWAASSLGRWDMIVEILAHDRHEFNDIYTKFHSRYCKHILTKVIGVTLEMVFMNKKWLWPEKDILCISAMSGHPEKLVDGKDTKILQELIKDCRKPVSRMSEELGIPQTTILQRIDGMLGRGVITNFRTAIFLSEFSRVVCKAFVYFSKAPPEEVQKLWNYCIHHPDVIYISKIIGPWEMEIDAHATSFDEFTRMMADIRKKFPNVVRNFEAVVINKSTGSFHTLPPD
jgi:DNA-binding Lrp family transcriptional regulator